jgi:hypothetical protein
MAHYKRITNTLSKGDTIDYPSSGSNTSILTVEAVSDDVDNVQYFISSDNKKFNVSLHHSALAEKMNVETEKPKVNRKELVSLAKGLGLDFPKNIKTPKLEALIEAKQNGAPVE